jgi:hypothetical protein
MTSTTTVRASGLLQSFTFDGTTVTYRRLLTTAKIPFRRVGSVQRTLGGKLTVEDTGGKSYTVNAWRAGRFARVLTDAIAARES